MIERQHMDVAEPARQSTTGALPDPTCPAGERKVAGASARLVDELGDLVRTLQRMGALELARLRVRVERSGLVVARALLLASAAFALGAALLAMFVFGLVGGLSALTGWPLWASALALGVTGPAAALLVIQVALARFERARLARLGQGALKERPAA